MVTSPANVLHRALGSEGYTMTTNELISCFMRAGYGLSKAKKRIHEYAEMGLIEINEHGNWVGVDI